MDRQQRLEAELMLQRGEILGAEAAKVERELRLDDHIEEWYGRQIKKMTTYAAKNGHQQESLILVNRYLRGDRAGAVRRLLGELEMQGWLTAEQAAEIDVICPPLPSAVERSQRLAQEEKLVKKAVDEILKQIPRRNRGMAQKLLSPFPTDLEDGRLAGWTRDLVGRRLLPEVWNTGHKDGRALFDLIRRLRGEGKMLAGIRNKMLTRPEENKGL